MHLVPILELPNFSDDTFENKGVDYCFFGSSNQGAEPHYLVYEKSRDFLSTPKAYIVVAMHSQIAGVEQNVESDFDCYENGFYFLEDEEGESDNSEKKLLMIMKNEMREFRCCSVEVVKTIYRSHSAVKAFKEYNGH